VLQQTISIELLLFKKLVIAEARVFVEVLGQRQIMNKRAIASSTVLILLKVTAEFIC
jgi:hypothetical protein